MNKNAIQSLDKEAKNILYATAKLLELLKVRVTITSISNTLFSHPHYLSLFSITESLQKWKIDTYPLKIDPPDLQDICGPFIAYLWHGRRFITVVETSPDAVYYFDEEDKRRRMNMDDFLQFWDGVILAAEPTEHSGENAYKALRQKERLNYYKLPLLAGTLLLLLTVKTCLVYPTAAAGYFAVLAACKTAGLLIALLLLIYDYDGQNALLKQLCSAGKKTNCSAVLTSKGAKIGGILSWSEVGFIYFTGGALFLLMAGTDALPLMCWLNLFALPYVVFSIAYQAFRVKQWCVLCLATQIILISEFLGAIATYNLSYLVRATESANVLLLLALSFFLPAFSWFFSKQYIYTAKTKHKLEQLLARFKNSPDVFLSMLQKQVPINGQPVNLGITLGNPDAANTLIKVCNPYCGPCAKAHPEIEALIDKNDNWKVQIIFSAKPVDNDLKFIAASHLMALAESFDKQNQSWMKTKALDEWYLSSYPSNEEKYQVFASRYPVNEALTEQKIKITAMHEWCESNGIMYTPTFFVNGYHLPEQYNVADLQYL